MIERNELEQHLLRHPFDAEARTKYGHALLDANEPEGALVQFELICQQRAQEATGFLGAAAALLKLQRTAEALSRYVQARGLAGFQSIEVFERMDAQARRGGSTQLRVVATSEPSNVVPLQRNPEERVNFATIVGNEQLKQTIRLKIIEPFVNPGLFQRFRKQAGGGILLYGPPGCGKTMIARAVANECSAEFISVGIADVLNMWIGESERNLAAQFDRARSKAPCVLFFDELDALAYSRSKANSEHTRTVVNEFLVQLDGIGKDNRGVLILAATNMPWDVDPAMKRPGHFSRQIFVPPPDVEARQRMFEIKLGGVPQGVLDVVALAQRTVHFSGADIDGLIELAKEKALHHVLLQKQERPLEQGDLEEAIKDISPSTLEWLRTARNLVKYAGIDGSYRDVEDYLKKAKLL